MIFFHRCWLLCYRIFILELCCQIGNWAKLPHTKYDKNGHSPLQIRVRPWSFMVDTTVQQWLDGAILIMFRRRDSPDDSCDDYMLGKMTIRLVVIRAANIMYGVGDWHMCPRPHMRVAVSMRWWETNDAPTKGRAGWQQGWLHDGEDEHSLCGDVQRWISCSMVWWAWGIQPQMRMRTVVPMSWIY